MADKTPSSGGGRLPDWWRSKLEQMPDPAPDPTPAPDWWDDLYADDTRAQADAADADTDQEDDTAQAAGPWWTPQPGYYPQFHAPAFITDQPSRPALSAKTRAGLYNGAAAGTGWALGLYDQLAAAIADCGEQSIGGALVLGVGACLLIAHVWDRRTRHWWPGLAWAARIPLATAVLALALWAPAAS